MAESLNRLPGFAPFFLANPSPQPSPATFAPFFLANPSPYATGAPLTVTGSHGMNRERISRLSVLSFLSFLPFFLIMKLSELFFHLSPFSGNTKTGPIAVSTSSRATCSPVCPFFQNGCYAESGPLLLHWRKVTEGVRGVSFDSFLLSLRNLEAGRLFRHNQAGDLPHTSGKISRLFIKKMAESVKHLKAFTYTHHDIKKGENLSLLRYANRNGFIVNVSTESESAADEAISAGLPAVMVANSNEERTSWQTPAGNTVLVCPAQRSDTRTCADCQLCHKRHRKVVIAFLAHGTGKRKANEALAPSSAF